MATLTRCDAHHHGDHRLLPAAQRLQRIPYAHRLWMMRRAMRQRSRRSMRRTRRRRRRLSRRSPTSGSWSTSRSPSGVGVLDDRERTISGGLLDVLLVIVVLGGNLHANSCQANIRQANKRTSKQANIRHAFNNMAHAFTIAMCMLLEAN
mgnify:CR=1 FL=1